jgi:hypothetical protein
MTFLQWYCFVVFLITLGEIRFLSWEVSFYKKQAELRLHGDLDAAIAAATDPGSWWKGKVK